MANKAENGGFSVLAQGSWQRCLNSTRGRRITCSSGDPSSCQYLPG